MAGDEDTYTKFADFLDKVIEFRHNGYTKDKQHKTDLNPGSLIESSIALSTYKNGRLLGLFYQHKTWEAWSLTIFYYTK